MSRLQGRRGAANFVCGEARLRAVENKPSCAYGVSRRVRVNAVPYMDVVMPREGTTPWMEEVRLQGRGR
jgi:hypothetical protein